MKIASYTLAGLVNPARLHWDTIPHESCVFHNRRGGPPQALRRVFFSTIVDILLAEPDSLVYYFADSDLSPDTTLLRALKSVGRFHLVSFSNASRALEKLTEEAPYGSHRSYIFADDLIRCIPQNAWPLLQKLMACHPNKLFFLSTHSDFPFPYDNRLWHKWLDNDMVTACENGLCLLVPTPNLPAKVQQLLQANARPDSSRSPRRNTPPILTQIILAVIAALLAFIASQLGG